MSVNIALDYDGTYTEDPDMWESFINLALKCGHKVYMVTMRTPEDILHGSEFHIKFPKHLIEKGDPILPTSIPNFQIVGTSHKAKKAYMLNQLQVEIDIWIDDNPKFIYEDATGPYPPSYYKLVSKK